MDMPSSTMKIAVLGYPIIFCAFCFLLVAIANKVVSAVDLSSATINLSFHFVVMVFGYLGLRVAFKNRNKQFFSYLLSILIIGSVFSVLYSHTMIIAAAAS